MKITTKKTGVIVILAITVIIMAAGWGKKESKVAAFVPTNDYMTEKGKTKLITRVKAAAEGSYDTW